MVMLDSRGKRCSCSCSLGNATRFRFIIVASFGLSYLEDPVSADPIYAMPLIYPIARI